MVHFQLHIFWGRSCISVSSCSGGCGTIDRAVGISSFYIKFYCKLKAKEDKEKDAANGPFLHFKNRPIFTLHFVSS